MLFDTSSPVVAIHMSFGISAFFVCLFIVILGMINAKRLGIKPNKITFKIHKYISLILIALLAASFFTEAIYFITGTGEDDFEAHGYIGLTALILSIAQVIPSLLIKARKKIKLIHSLFGYIIFLLMIIQLLTGLSEIFD
jgi:cytochrome b561